MLKHFQQLLTNQLSNDVMQIDAPSCLCINRIHVDDDSANSML